MEKLTPAHFTFRCPMVWDDMPASEHGRFCGKCRKEVHDLSNCSIDEVIALQRKHGPICGSIKVAVAAVSLATAACQSDPPPRMLGTPLAPGKFEKKQEVVMPGVICPPEALEKSKETKDR